MLAPPHRDCRKVFKDDIDPKTLSIDPKPYRQFTKATVSHCVSCKEIGHGRKQMISPETHRWTVSVAIGHRECHPVYTSPDDLSNTARYVLWVMVMAMSLLFFPSSPETSGRQSSRPSRGMAKPEVVLCPDGHFHRAILSLGPYIADYPEQVWLAKIVQGWCPKRVIRPGNLGDKNAHRRPSHKKSGFIVSTFIPLPAFKDHPVESALMKVYNVVRNAVTTWLCSSIIESKHMKAVKKGMLIGSKAEYIARGFSARNTASVDILSAENEDADSEVGYDR
ncbi:hypothetical protein CVT26_016207 [Gymnopilus dilepis]|uniref:Uncharacterized protein n=1 Tax=Gymnopilus dilepis TaxID=231916 RepID=A0A409XZ47_9AGAR|nr:hypothetical protein CVT26_016207 [Gymnopilus dilepis]